jgi:Ca-activated chloride channel family protein
MFHHWFANPWSLALLGLLPVLPLLGLLAWFRRRRALDCLGNAVLLQVLIVTRNGFPLVREILLGSGLALVVLGVAGPQWGRDWNAALAPGRDLIVVLDLSRSMFAEQPSRLERSQAALADLVRTLKERGGHRLGLVVFAGRAYVACPLTHDYDHFHEAVEAMDPEHLPAEIAMTENEPSGTRIGAGLQAAVELHDPRFRGSQDILLLSDGDDPSRDPDWRWPAAEARTNDIPIHTVAIGDPDLESSIPLTESKVLEREGQPVLTRMQQASLHEIADLTEGVFIDAGTKSVPLGKLYQEIVQSQAVHLDTDDNLPLYRQRYPWFLGAAFLLLAVEMVAARKTRRQGDKETRRQGDKETRNNGLGLSPCLLVSLPPCLLLLGAAALVSPDELVRQGNVALARQDYAAALRLFEQAEVRSADPGLVAFNQAVALSSQGHHAQAEGQFRLCLEDAVGRRRSAALYNLAGCLVQQGGERDIRRLLEAITLYRQCLHEDDLDDKLAAQAAHNLELAGLLWIRACAPRTEDPRTDTSPQDPSSRPARQPDDRPPDQVEPGEGSSKPGKDRKPLPRDASKSSTATTDETSPGAGNLQVIPDRGKLEPMSAEDAIQYLQQSLERVLQEGRSHRKRSLRPLPGNVLDW